jgi:hypothetical protein
VVHSSKCFCFQLNVSNGESLTLTFVQFIDLANSPLPSSGGAGYASVASVIAISGCSFICCRVPWDSTSGQGGACYLSSGSAASIVNSCAVSCIASAVQFALFVSEPETGHLLNASSFVECGTLPAGDKG